MTKQDIEFAIELKSKSTITDMIVEYNYNYTAHVFLLTFSSRRRPCTYLYKNRIENEYIPSLIYSPKPYKAMYIFLSIYVLSIKYLGFLNYTNMDS